MKISESPMDMELLMLKSGSVGDDIEILEKDREIHTDPDETRRRRTIKLHKEKGSWGFTLQTYGIKNKRTNCLDVMTYVDYVELNSPANYAGMRKGDVILSVNGTTVEGYTHRELVKRIQESAQTLRLVVLFEDCCRKVELYDRFIKLQRLLSHKYEELRSLEMKEMSILQAHGISRVSELRQSMRSTSSSEWDRFSLISPSAVQTTPNTHIWREFSCTSMSSQPSHSNNNSLDDFSLCNDSFSEDSDAFLSSSASCLDISMISGKQKEDTISTRSVNSQNTFNEGSSENLDSLEESTSSLDPEIVPSESPESSLSRAEKEFDESDDGVEMNIKAGNSVALKDMGDNASGMKYSDEPKRNDSSRNVSGCLDQNVEERQETETQSKGDNSSSPQTTPGLGSNGSTRKRFVHGILVNDQDFDTKL